MLDSSRFPGVFAATPDPHAFCATARAAAAAGPAGWAASGPRVVIRSPENGHLYHADHVTVLVRYAMGGGEGRPSGVVLQAAGPLGRSETWVTAAGGDAEEGLREVGGGLWELEAAGRGRLEPAGVWRLRVGLMGTQRRVVAWDMVAFVVLET